MAVKLHVVDHPPKKVLPQSALVLHVTAGDTKLPSMATWIDKELGGALKKELNRRKFSGAAGTSTMINSKYGPTIVVGVGKRPVNLDRIRQAAATAVSEAKKHHVAVLATPVTGGKRLSPESVARAVTEGAMLADYQFSKYKQSTTQTSLDFYLTQAGKNQAAAKRGVAGGTIEAEAVMFARDLVNEPPSHMHPRQLAAEAKRIASKNGLRTTVLGPKEMAKAGLTATLAVSKGSDEPPQFIKLSYLPSKPKKHVVLVGKGVTFDSGGINLKPSKGGMLEAMKMDMAGSAAVIATMSALKRLGVKHKVTAYVAATENLLGGSAYKPGDVVKTYNGKTAEVGNTDAEGRLTLADALSYAVDKEKPDEIIDLATLTGAAVVALGNDIAALFANNDKLAERFEQASQVSGEKVWRLPLEPAYNDLIKSSIADLHNTGSGSGAGSITAALFLQNFVGKTPWIHLDIAGPAWAEKEKGYLKTGGTGYGVRTLLHYLQNA